MYSVACNVKDVVALAQSARTHIDLVPQPRLPRKTMPLMLSQDAGSSSSPTFASAVPRLFWVIAQSSDAYYQI